MTIKHKNQRVGVFIDVQNLYHSAKNLYNKRVNFKNLLLEAVSDRQLIRAIAYAAQSAELTEESFFEALEKIGIEVKRKELQVYPDGSKKGDWDVGLAMDAIRIGHNLDVVILISGDGDFIPLIEHLKTEGKYVEVIAFGRTTSTRLKEAADEFIDLDERPEYFLLKTEEGFKVKMPAIIRIKRK